MTPMPLLMTVKHIMAGTSALVGPRNCVASPGRLVVAHFFSKTKLRSNARLLGPIETSMGKTPVLVRKQKLIRKNLI